MQPQIKILKLSTIAALLDYIIAHTIITVISLVIDTFVYADIAILIT